MGVQCSAISSSFNDIPEYDVQVQRTILHSHIPTHISEYQTLRHPRTATATAAGSRHET